MATRLGGVCRDARERRGLRAIDVAITAGVSEATVSRFERGEGWPRDTDGMVAAYASELEVEPLELWRRAVGVDNRSGG